jgi:hypothetical protein
MLKEYIKSDGKIFEVVGRDGEGRPVTKVTNLTEIPEDKPLVKPEVKEEVTEKPKRTRKTK